MFLWELLVLSSNDNVFYLRLHAADEIQANEELIRTSLLFHPEPSKMIRIVKLQDELTL